MRVRRRTCQVVLATALFAGIGVLHVPAVAAAAARPDVPGELIVNGSFESPQLSPYEWETYGPGQIPGWDPTNGCGLELQNQTVINAYEGDQYLELASNCVSGVTQTLATTPGQTYRVGFVFTSRPGTDPSANTTSVTWDGKEFANLQGTDQWVAYHYDLTATSTTTVLAFNDTDPNFGDSEGDFFDDVSVVPTSTALVQQAISFAPIPDHTYSDPPFTVTANGGGSGQPVTFLSLTPSTCTVTPSGTVTLTGSKGTCSIQASQAGTASYRSAPPVVRTLAVTGPLVHVTVTGQQVYGGALSYTHHVSGLPRGQTLHGTLTCTAPAAARHVGSYSVTSTDCHGLSAPAPYDVAYSGSVTVSPAVLTITAPDATMTAGDKVPAVHPTYRGFVNGDTAASLSKAPTCGTTATTRSPAGTYSTTCSGAASRDYTIHYVAGQLHVAAAAVRHTVHAATLPTTGKGLRGLGAAGAALVLLGGICMLASVAGRREDAAAPR